MTLSHRANDSYVLLTHKNTQFSHFNPVPQRETSKALGWCLLNPFKFEDWKANVLFWGLLDKPRRQTQLNTWWKPNSETNNTEESRTSLGSRNMGFKATSDQSKTDRPKIGFGAPCVTRKKLTCRATTSLWMLSRHPAHHSKRKFFQQEEKKTLEKYLKTLRD